MKKKEKILLWIGLLFIPTVVLAKTGQLNASQSFTLFMEAFVTIHMSVFVLLPLSHLFSENNSKRLFWILFVTRAAILLYFDFFITDSIAYVDFIAVFIGTFIVIPICALIKRKNPFDFSSKNVKQSSSSTPQEEIVLTCTKCGGVMKVTDKFCENCGAPFDGNNVSVSTQKKVLVSPSNFEAMYNKTEEQLLEEFIKKELQKAELENTKQMPADALKRKNILSIIFSLLLFVYISLIFFHFPILTYIVGLIILFIFFRLSRKFNLMKYLKKEVKARPSEKISNIVMSVKNSFMEDNWKSIRRAIMVLAILLPNLIFMNPRIMYEKVEKGYAVRYYIFGLKNFKTATIPATYKNENVVSLRGNAFSNMPYLTSVSLPDTITEIRGQAFKNDYSLQEITLPEHLEYLGGGSFYNCISLKSIVIPDSVTFMGGETFVEADALERVQLSRNLREIRGDSFRGCSSLRTITIPDSVERIGGHAFYGSALTEVILTPNSQLREIGSSAFRYCTDLSSITLPKGVYINERAFKESPTRIYYFDE